MNPSTIYILNDLNKAKKKFPELTLDQFYLDRGLRGARFETNGCVLSSSNGKAIAKGCGCLK